jgi:hypothetical protein
MKIRRLAIVVVGTLCAAIGFATATLAKASPSHGRSWRLEQAVLPEISIDDDTVQIRNVRDFEHRSTEEFTPRYHDGIYALDQVERVWFVLSPFERDWRGPAHIFLSFGFADGRFLSISVEARREADEEYSILKGALRRFELMYVIAEERDLIGLRTVAWDDPVYLYPIRATPDQVRQLFLLLLEDARKLESEPRFYNTFTDNCTTNILAAVNQVASTPVPFGWEILLPGYSDRIVHQRGLIDTDLPLEEARQRFEINRVAKAAAGAPDFSTRIRL